jgi:pheromone shutdown-related protein TraB
MAYGPYICKNQQMHETKIKDNVDLIEFDEKKIYLVGTAHISKISADLVEEVIREIKPDSVAVEICDSRYQSLKDPERWKNTDIVTVIKAGRIYVLLAQLILASFQKKLGQQLDIQPGAEMMRAMKVADEIGAKTVLADREVKITLKRVWSNVGFWGGAKIILAMGSALLSKEKISQEEIEKLKSQDALDSALKEFSEKLPKVRKPLIDERDQYLAAKISAAPGNIVVAVIGAGHIPGIKKNLTKNINLAELEIVPPKGIVIKLVGWSLPAMIIGFIIYGFFGSGFQASLNMLEAWFWITGFMGALGAALAVAHPITIIAAFLGTPLATLHPLIAAGWIAGLVEAYLRKPRVSDFENITDDMATVRGFWTNRVTRIILVIAFTNIFATIGMIWGAKVLAGLVF